MGSAGVRSLLWYLFPLLLFTSACGRSNNLLLGRVETRLGPHRVVVTDCYRIAVPPPSMTRDATTGKTSLHWTPLRDADILIRENEVSVNTRNYGRISPNGSLLVDHGQVSIEP